MVPYFKGRKLILTYVCTTFLVCHYYVAHLSKEKSSSFSLQKNLERTYFVKLKFLNAKLDPFLQDRCKLDQKIKYIRVIVLHLCYYLKYILTTLILTKNYLMANSRLLIPICKSHFSFTESDSTTRYTYSKLIAQNLIQKPRDLRENERSLDSSQVFKI